jgi:hypothetical protein
MLTLSAILFLHSKRTPIQKHSTLATTSHTDKANMAFNSNIEFLHSHLSPPPMPPNASSQSINSSVEEAAPPPPPYTPESLLPSGKSLQRHRTFLASFLSIRCTMAILSISTFAIGMVAVVHDVGHNKFLMSTFALSLGYSLGEIIIYSRQLYHKMPYRLDILPPGQTTQNKLEQQAIEVRTRPNVRGGPFLDMVIGLLMVAALVNWLQVTIEEHDRCNRSSALTDEARRECYGDNLLVYGWIIGMTLACAHILFSGATSIMYCIFLRKIRKGAKKEEMEL